MAGNFEFEDPCGYSQTPKMHDLDTFYNQKLQVELLEIGENNFIIVSIGFGATQL